MSEEKQIVKYETDYGIVKLTPTVIRNLICKNASDKEIKQFITLCAMQKLNPFLREAYLIKYSDTEPASMVVGYEVFLKRAFKNQYYQGYKSGILDWDDEKKRRAFCEVFLKGYVTPIRVEVYWEEYAGKKKDGTLTKFWAKQGRTQLEKVAISQALRRAFPLDLGGLYTADEIDTVDPNELPTEIIDYEVHDMGDTQSQEASGQSSETTSNALVGDDGVAGEPSPATPGPELVKTEDAERSSLQEKIKNLLKTKGEKLNMIEWQRHFEKHYPNCPCGIYDLSLDALRELLEYTVGKLEKGNK
jgi:phage recombination protein Bet